MNFHQGRRSGFIFNNLKMEQLLRILKREYPNVDAQLTQDLAAAKGKCADYERSYQTVKDWAHRVEGKLMTLIEKFDEYADGSPDATPLGVFCNEMIGLSNEISLGTVRTVIKERDEAKAEVERLKKETANNAGKVCSICNWTNGGCLNVSNPNEEPFWICHGCIKREHDQLTAHANALRKNKELFAALDKQLECPARNTTMTGYRRDGSVVISLDLRQQVKEILTEIDRVLKEAKK